MQQHASLAAWFSSPILEAKYLSATITVRTMARRSEPRAIEPSEVVHARTSPAHTAGRQQRQPRSVVSLGEKYQLPTAAQVVTLEMQRMLRHTIRATAAQACASVDGAPQRRARFRTEHRWGAQHRSVAPAVEHLAHV